MARTEFESASWIRTTLSFFFSFSLPNDFLNCGKIYITFTTLKHTIRWHLVNSWCLTLVYSFIVSCSWAWGSSSLKWEWCCEHWPRHLMWPDRLPWWPRWKRIFLQCRRPGFDPWVGKIPWKRKREPTPVFSPGEQYCLAGYCPWSGKERVILLFLYELYLRVAK